MFSLLSKNKNKNLSLIIDIQSGLVRGALVSLDPGGVPHILYIASHLLQHKEEPDGSYLTSTMLKAVEEVVNRIALEGKAPNNIHYVMSSPWVISQSKTIKIHYEKETEITKGIIDEIVEGEREGFMDKFRKGNFSKEYEFDLVFIEQKVFDVRLNGYSVQDYKGKKTKDLEVSFAVTTSSKEILEKIRSSISKAVGISHEAYHSALLLQYSALRSLVGNRDEYISLHVHSELTDIVVVKRGVSSYLASFPFGTADFLRKMSKDMKSSEETVKSLISMYGDGKLETSEEEKVKKILSPTLLDWQKKCLESLGSIGEKTILPRLVYLSAHAYFDLFKNTLIETQFEVLPFDEELVDKAVIFEKGFDKSQLVGMYALALKNMI